MFVDLPLENGRIIKVRVTCIDVVSSTSHKGVTNVSLNGTVYDVVKTVDEVMTMITDNTQ